MLRGETGSVDGLSQHHRGQGALGHNALACLQTSWWPGSFSLLPPFRAPGLSDGQTPEVLRSLPAQIFHFPLLLSSPPPLSSLPVSRSPFHPMPSPLLSLILASPPLALPPPHLLLHVSQGLLSNSSLQGARSPFLYPGTHLPGPLESSPCALTSSCLLHGR